MSRLTGREVASLMEAYSAVYAPQEEVELTEEQVQEDFENWVNSLVQEGYDLSKYTWEDMYEHYLNEYAGGQGQSAADLAKQRQASQAATTSRKINAGEVIRTGTAGILNNLGLGRATALQRNQAGNLNVLPGSAGGLDKSIRLGGQSYDRLTRGNNVTYVRRGNTSAPTAQPPARPAAQPPARPSAAAARPAAPVTSGKPIPTATTPSMTPMQQWAKANPTLAAAAAEKARIRGTSQTDNPLMRDMRSKLPAPTSAQAPAVAKLGPGNQSLVNNPNVPKTAPQKKTLSAGVDLFDVIKGHLIDEGYADTEEAALTIMANMSEEWRQSIVEAIDMTKTDAYKNAQTKEATKFYTTPIKPLPPYQAKTPRFPALTVPDFGLGTNKPKTPSVRRDDGRTERPVPPRTERPVAPRQRGTESQKPKPQVTPAQPKPEATPYKGPGYKKDTSIQDMIDRSKQRQQAPKAEAPKAEAPRQPISPGAAGAEGVKFVERGSSAAAGSPAKPVRDQMTGLSPRERSQMKR